MNPLRIVAQSDWLRLTLGGLVSGCAIYLLVSEYPQIVWIAVPIAFAIGAVSCFACEHMFEAVFKAVLAAIIMFFALRIASKIIVEGVAWWKVVLVSLPIGFLGGMGIGSLLGAMCRLLYDPNIRPNDHKPTT